VCCKSFFFGRAPPGPAGGEYALSRPPSLNGGLFQRAEIKAEEGRGLLYVEEGGGGLLIRGQKGGKGGKMGRKGRGKPR